MKKNEILKSIKLALILSIFTIGVIGVSAYDWEEPDCTPPGCDTSSEVFDISNTTQTKLGKLYIQDNTDTATEEGTLTADRFYAWDTTIFQDSLRIGVAGITGEPNLFVKSSVIFRNLGTDSNEPGVDYSDWDYPSDVCVDSSGKVINCDVEIITPPTEDQFFDPSTDITVAKNTSTSDGTTLEATCPASHPYVIGGGGFCHEPGFLSRKGIQATRPEKNGAGNPEGGNNAWFLKCRSNTDRDVYAVCSK